MPVKICCSYTRSQSNKILKWPFHHVQEDACCRTAKSCHYHLQDTVNRMRTVIWKMKPHYFEKLRMGIVDLSTTCSMSQCPVSTMNHNKSLYIAHIAHLLAFTPRTNKVSKLIWSGCHCETIKQCTQQNSAVILTLTKKQTESPSSPLNVTKLNLIM